jgi:2-oxoacid:acceptor oxidoreductase delta subunit (pyruvate/2-ketoisovalerate family)
MSDKAAMEKIERKKGWREIPPAGMIVDPGNSVLYQTGDWRSMRPTFHADRCIQCFFCWIYCPDQSIVVEDKKVVGIDYDHCKGCGVCSTECPTKPEKAITMSEEAAP